ncbi:hypothetical protein [Amycolatopsis sp.]|jgi:hypothetical protein|uniref:hypothetical protein n=1 Tax=Amycolatopsis sp. TaxID=37632 RepID=UPI002DF7D596|nr:hypothetical protein [Amycolatopsis sp.]
MTGQVSDQTSSKSSGGSPTPQVAKDKAAELGQAAGERGGQVASTVADEAKQVAAQARREAKDLMDEGLGQLREQTREGQRKTAKSLRAIADQLDDMSGKADAPGVATDVVQEVSERARSVASWLEAREPGDLLSEVRGFARRRPGVFLAGAAVAGVLAGRLTRGVVAEVKQDSGDGARDRVPAHTSESVEAGATPSSLPSYREPEHIAPPPAGEPAAPVTPPLPQSSPPATTPLPQQGTAVPGRQGQVRP